MEQQTYKHGLPAISNVHRIPFLFGWANAVIGLDVGGGNGNSHRLNVSSLPINPSISAISFAILCRSFFPNPCWGLAAKCASICLCNTACSHSLQIITWKSGKWVKYSIVNLWNDDFFTILNYFRVSLPLINDLTFVATLHFHIIRVPPYL